LNDQERLKRILWNKLYSDKSLQLLRVMREMEFGEITVTIHQGTPQKIQKPYQSIMLKPLTIDPSEVDNESVD
jgi:hypothetical protein